ncbi:MAG: hypothetical protein M0Q14_10675 [Tissierellaceae bacterium]|nr:hypothetical protein [Tissierellaceae bacterium]
MPTVKELIKDIDERMPNRFSDGTKIRWMNTFQKQIFRKLNIPGVYSFNTIADIGVYKLPDSCSMDLIEEVIYEEIRLPFKSLQQDATGTFYYTIAGQMGIYPRPEKDDELVTVFYRIRPKILTEDEMEHEIPEITEDYHELLILHVLITIAKAREDADLANAYTYDLEELILNLQMDLIEREPEYVHTRDTLGARYAEEDEW